MSDDGSPLIIVRRPRRKKHGHHGGAWKVAYADFVTAMMAFFLVMWLLGIGTREQRAAISEYFKNPSMQPGNATMAPPGRFGAGGASDSLIKLGGARDRPHGPGKDRRGIAAAGHAGTGTADKIQAEKQAEKRARQADHERLDELRQQLHAAIEKSQAMAPFKDQLLIDITPEGLRIQIVDKLNRPMFDLGKAQLKPYTSDILRELAGFIDSVPNKISISGHTDNTPYGDGVKYSNWELSADRANAARRALLAGGLLEDKMARVVGLADAVPFDKANPADPTNRRISIIVMSRQAQAAALSQELGEAVAVGAAPAAATAQPAPARPAPDRPAVGGTPGVMGAPASP